MGRKLIFYSGPTRRVLWVAFSGILLVSGCATEEKPRATASITQAHPVQDVHAALDVENRAHPDKVQETGQEKIPEKIPEKIIEMKSPDQAIKIIFSVSRAEGGTPAYALYFHDRAIIESSPLGLKLSNLDLSSGFKLVGFNHRASDTSYELNFGKTSSVRDRYQEYGIELTHAGLTANSEVKLNIQFRLYNDGIAFRYQLPAQLGQPEVDQATLLEETTGYFPAGNPVVYGLPMGFRSAYEAKYLRSPLKNLRPNQYFGLPLAMQFEREAFVLFSEAGVHNFPQSYLRSPSSATTGFATIYPTTPIGDPLPVLRDANSVFPWRVVLIGSSEKTIIESNMISSLSDPSVDTETEWIHPGKVLFQWWNGYFGSPPPPKTKSGSEPEQAARAADVLNTQTLKSQIDFCAKYGIESFSLDGYEFEKAWYGGKVLPYEGQDVTKAAPDIDLPELFAYAKEKGVRSRIWLHGGALNDANVDHVFSTYEGWGVSGVMVDFMGDDTQAGALFVESILRTALNHHLTVALHGIAKPTGLTRTYPNYLSQEGVLGQEYNKWPGENSTPDHEINIAFIRGAVGPMDTHEGAFRPVPQSQFVAKTIAPNSIGTLARQLAMYVVYENEQPMLADYPQAYEAHPEAFKFVRDVPVSWDETRLIAGSLEEKYITVARRHGRDWYLGSMTGANAKSYLVPLSFLGPGKYQVDLYSDSVESAVDGEKIEISHSQIVDGTKSLSIFLAPAGGQVAHFKPLP